MTTLLPAAVLWDMDGTLVDTEPYWMSAEIELVESFGGTWTYDDAMQLVGSGLYHSARVLQAHGVNLSEDEIIDRMSDRVIAQIDVAVPWRAGALELLTELGELGVPTALVTMSIRRMADRVAQAVGGVGFGAIVAGDEVSHSKPHPAPYLMGAAALGVAASDCVALEDSAPGVASATAAGAVVIGVPMHIALVEDSSYDLWSELQGKSAEDLFTVYRERRSA